MAAKHSNDDSSVLRESRFSREPNTGAVMSMNALDQYRVEEKRRRKGPWGCLIAFLIMILIISGVVGYFGYQLYSSAKEVRDEAKWMLSQVDTLKKAVKTGDEETLDETVAQLVDRSQWMYDETHSDLWEFAAGIPTYGEDIRTAQTLSEVAVSLTHDVLLPVSETIGGVKLSSLVQDGRINIELLRDLTDMLFVYVPLIDEQMEIIDNLPDAHIDKLQSILDKLQDPIAEYRPMIELAEKYLPLLPPMLGADGETRVYLIIAMTNSELRSAGGFPGAWGTIEITDGEFHLGSFTSIVHEEGMNVELLDGEGVYNFGIQSGPSAVTAMPNFNRTGELAADYWRQWSGQSVDGVVAIDPVALERLIELTGSEFDTSDGTHIDGTNASFEILHNVYVRYWNDNEAHDAFFAEVAKKSFSAFFSNLGHVKIGKFFTTVMALGAEGRFQIWMANPEEEELISEFGFGGEFSHDPLNPVLGIYLNDQTYSKIDWFLAANVVVGEPTVNEDGSATYDVTFVLSNTITYDFANNTTVYITGKNEEKRDITDMITTVFISMPQDAVLESFSSDPEHDYWSGWPEGIQVIKFISNDRGGTSSTYHLRITVPAGAEPLTVHVTPLAQEENLTITYEYL